MDDDSPEIDCDCCVCLGIACHFDHPGHSHPKELDWFDAMIEEFVFQKSMMGVEGDEEDEDDDEYE